MENKKTQINISRRKKNNLVVLVLVAIIFAILVFSIWFCYEKIRQGSEGIVNAIKGIKLSEIQAVQIKDFQSKYQDYLPSLEKIDRSIVDPKNPLDFIEFLENSAEEQSVSITIYPILFPKEPGAQVVSVKFSAQGPFKNTVNFLEKIEGGVYLALIRSLTIESVKSDSKSSSESVMASVVMDILVN